MLSDRRGRAVVSEEIAEVLEGEGAIELRGPEHHHLLLIQEMDFPILILSKRLMKLIQALMWLKNHLDLHIHLSIIRRIQTHRLKMA